MQSMGPLEKPARPAIRPFPKGLLRFVFARTLRGFLGDKMGIRSSRRGESRSWTVGETRAARQTNRGCLLMRYHAGDDGIPEGLHLGAGHVVTAFLSVRGKDENVVDAGL